MTYFITLAAIFEYVLRYDIICYTLGRKGYSSIIKCLAV